MGIAMITDRLNIPQFKLIRELGRGGMSTVYLAVQEALERQVALKVMVPGLAADESFRKRFINEGRTIARLSHPNIVTVHDIGATEQHLYMALEYAEGGNLSRRIRRGMSIDEAIEVVIEIGMALAYAHERGIIHRDVKSANIIFRNDGSAILTDFGVAKSILADGTQLTQAGVAVGTPRYMSPEQALSKNVTAQSDLYSLGIIFHEMLTGRCPYEADESSTPFSIFFKHINDPIPTLPDELRDFQPIIDRMLAKAPEARFASAHEMIATLREHIETRETWPQSRPDPDRTDLASRTPLPSTPKPFVPQAPSEPRQPAAANTPAALRAPPRSSQRARQAKSVVVFGIGIILLAVGLAGYMLTRTPQGAIDTLPPIQIDDALSLRQQKLDSLDAAANTYRELQAMDTGDADAALPLRELQDELVAAYAEIANESWAELDPLSAQAAIERGREIDPDASRLIDLHRRIEGSTADDAEIAQWLETADGLYRDGYYLMPAENNAVALYKQILFYRPDNEIAHSRLIALADVFAERANEALEHNDPTALGAALEQGLLIYPSHPELSALKERVTRRTEPH